MSLKILHKLYNYIYHSYQICKINDQNNKISRVKILTLNITFFECIHNHKNVGARLTRFILIIPYIDYNALK